MPQEDACVTERHHRTHNANYAVDNNARKRLEQPKPGGSPSTRMIPRRKARSPMTRPRRNLEGSVTQRDDTSAVMAKFKARTDKYNAEVVSQAQERSQNGNQ